MQSTFRFVLNNLLFTIVSGGAALCHSEVTSLAKPYLSEATGLVGVHCPEATRLVDMPHPSCFCGGRYDRGQCQRDDCPRARLGHGSWRVALPKLQEMRSKGKLADRYPQLDLAVLRDHVERGIEQRLEHERRQHHRTQRGNSLDRGRQHDREDQSEQERQREHSEGRRRVWRKPRQPNSPPPSMASSSTSQLPVQKIKIEPVMDGASTDGDEDEGGYASEITVLDSDGSHASVFGLRSALHEVEEDDELSEASSHDEDERAVAERERVNTWRTENFLQYDLDFAYVFVDFEQAYSHAGRAVAVAWSRARFLAEPELVTDEAKISAIEATATKVRKVDGERKKKAVDKKNLAKAPFLRQPGKGTEPEEAEENKVRFIEPLAQLMMDCRVGRSGNASATDEEIMSSLKRKATRVVIAYDVPTLHRAITTANEVRKYLDRRAAHMGVDYVEPTVLEEFLWQASARGRAVSSITWMCKNLQLGWPIDKVEQPDVEKVSLSGMECRQAPAAQPGMLKALEDTMEAAAEVDDPTWLALLASWLQAMANLRLVHLLRRSVPVELYDGWMLFFCKQSKQRHNRAGFYWGVPSKTSSDYIWTEKFLLEYNRRRQSIVGKEMMGMIFRTDTLEYLSSKAVNALTIEAVAGIVENPELLATYSWKRMLPTTALHLNFSPAERLAIGDWKDTKAMRDEAPITPRYAEVKEGKSRVCKLICAEVFAVLTKMNTQTFDEIPAQQWELLAAEARSKVESKPLEIKACWRNPDVAEAGGGFKVKKSQITFPKQLAGVPLAPSSRDGKRYCVDFQSGKCQGADTCQLGLHRCAAVFRGGRTCHGNHPGFACRNTKRHALVEEAVPDVKLEEPEKAVPEVELEEPEKAVPEVKMGEAVPEGPSQKKVKLDEPEDQLEPGKAMVILSPRSKAMPKAKMQTVPKCVNDDSIMRRMLPELRGEKGGVRGNRINPEPPRLVAKVCSEEGKGELWLGPLPTAERMDRILETKPCIQIYCFVKDPTQVQVERDSGEGMYIPGSIPFRCEMSNPHARLSDMRVLRPCLVNSLRQGDNAYVHCISGITRAPMAAAVMSAMLMGISFEEAKDIINQTRNVSFASGQRLQGAWIDRVLREGWTNAEAPTGFSCSAASKDNIVVHATTVVDGDTEPICRWEKGATGEHDLIMTAETIEQASNQFGGRFCANCNALLRASLKVQVKRFYS